MYGNTKDDDEEDHINLDEPLDKLNPSKHFEILTRTDSLERVSSLRLV